MIQAYMKDDGEVIVADFPEGYRILDITEPIKHGDLCYSPERNAFVLSILPQIGRIRQLSFHYPYLRKI